MNYEVLFYLFYHVLTVLPPLNEFHFITPLPLHSLQIKKDGIKLDKKVSEVNRKSRRTGVFLHKKYTCSIRFLFSVVKREGECI